MLKSAKYSFPKKMLPKITRLGSGILLGVLVLCGCDQIPSLPTTPSNKQFTEQDTENNKNSLPPEIFTDANLDSQNIDSNQTAVTSATIVPPPPPTDNISFYSNGNLIQGWHWIRDYSLNNYATWTLRNVPTGAASISLDFYVLATNRSSGDRGYDAKFLLYYGRDEDHLYSKQVTLPNVSSRNDPIGYDCRGQVLIPTNDLNGSSDLYLRVVRMDKADHHIAFKKESIVNFLGSAEYTSGGDIAELTDDDPVTDSPNTDIDTVVDTTDTDGDGLTDSQEDLYGLNSGSTDSDGDGVSDLDDLSPAINPEEPAITDFHPAGMIRIEQPIEAIGLDGWVEKYHKVYSLIPPSSHYVHDYTEEDEGTKKSTMDHATYIKALDKVFEPEKFVAYKIEDKTPADLYIAEVELEHDYIHEHDYTYRAGITHPNEYRFYYDELTDYALAYLKNSEAIKYPSEDSYFHLITQPIKLARGYDQNISIQFKSPSIYQELSYQDDNHYKVPAFLFSLYRSDDYDNNTNINIHDGFALSMIEAEGRFQADLKIPAPKTNVSQNYLKLVPIWYVKNGHQESYKPMNPTWDITGLSRNVVLLENDSGGSRIITQDLASWANLNTLPPSSSYFSGKIGGSDYQSSSSHLRTIQFDSQKESDRYDIMESDYNVQTYTEKNGAVLSSFVSQTENMVTAHWKVDEIGDLPETHWARSPKYNTAVATLAGVQGVMSLVSDGSSVWTACKEGNTIDIVYYSARSGLDVVNTAASLAQVGERTIGYAGKAGKFAKLTTKKAAVGLAIAAGAIEISYNAYQLANTEDPILQLAYEEKIAATTIDTGLSVASVFSPHTLVFQLTWTAEAEIYSLIFGEDFAYRIAQSPGSALVFLGTYFITGGIDSTMAETAYLDTRDELMDFLEINNAVSLSYLTIFIDPDL